MNKELEIERDSLKERVGKYEDIHAKMSSEHEEYAQYKQKWQLQCSEVEKMTNTLGEEHRSKERLYSEVCR